MGSTSSYSAWDYLSSHELSQARGEGQSGDEQGHQSREEQASREIGFTASNIGGARTTGERLGALINLKAEVTAEPWLLHERAKDPLAVHGMTTARVMAINQLSVGSRLSKWVAVTESPSPSCLLDTSELCLLPLPSEALAQGHIV